MDKMTSLTHLRDDLVALRYNADRHWAKGRATYFLRLTLAIVAGGSEYQAVADDILVAWTDVHACRKEDDD